MTDRAVRHKPEIEIRLATAADAPSISAVLLQSFIEYKSAYTAAGFAATTPDVERIHARILEGPVWLALLERVVAGTVSAVLEGDSLYVRGMAVLPAARGHRIGELLMARVEGFARSQKCKRLFLSTTPFLSRAIALYVRLGFSRTGEGPHDLCSTPLLTMERIIEPSF
ncbi:MAG: GNAT family N-acetyltransferase [Acidobacteriota bacterium]